MNFWFNVKCDWAQIAYYLCLARRVYMNPTTKKIHVWWIWT